MPAVRSDSSGLRVEGGVVRTELGGGEAGPGDGEAAGVPVEDTGDVEDGDAGVGVFGCVCDRPAGPGVGVLGCVCDRPAGPGVVGRVAAGDAVGGAAAGVGTAAALEVTTSSRTALVVSATGGFIVTGADRTVTGLSSVTGAEVLAGEPRLD